jgi:hypothetical protein
MFRAILAAAVLAGACAPPDGAGNDVDAATPDAPARPRPQPGGVTAPILWWAWGAPDGTRLIDVTGSGKDAVAAAPAIDNRTEARLFNFNPAVSFTDEVLEVADGIFPTAQPPILVPAVEVFAVFRDRDRVGTRQWIFREGGASRFALAKDWDVAGAIAFDLGPRCRATAGASLENEPLFVVGAACAASTGATSHLAINGVAAAGAAQFDGFTAPGGPLQLGGCVVGDDCPGHWRGVIAEIYVVAAALDAAARARITSTLALRWGLTLAADVVDATGRVLWPDEPRWRHDVAAIARDDAAGLDQRQANPYNTVLTVAAGAAAPTNAENPTVIPDGAALVWGHDDVGLYWTGGPTGARFRNGRTWRFVATGAVGAVTLRWAAAEDDAPEEVAAVAATDADDLFLWISGRPELTAPIATPVTREGNVWVARATFPPGTSYATLIIR